MGQYVNNNGGFNGLSINYDFTWHYDPATDAVIVTNSAVNFVTSAARNPTLFTDTLLMAKPDMKLPYESGSFKVNFSSLKETVNDVAGVTPQSLYDRYGKDAFVFASVITGYSRHDYWVKTNNNLGIYKAKNLGNHKYLLATAFDRARGVKPQGSTDYPWGDAIQGAINYPIWVEMPNVVTVQLPQPPKQPPVQEIHYHYIKTTYIDRIVK